MPTRRSSRLRDAAAQASTDGTTTPASAAEAAIALSVVAPLSRRASRQRPVAADTPAVNSAAGEPAAPLVAKTRETTVADIADVPVAPAPITVETKPAAAEAASRVSAHPSVEDDVDAFERASRAFSNTGSVPTAADSEQAATEQRPAGAVPPTSTFVAHVAPRRSRSVRKVFAVGATVGVMSLAGLLAVSMTLPAEAVAAVQSAPGASMSLVSAGSAGAEATDEEEIQAFVAPSGVENESLVRADDFSTVSLVQVAAEQGINYSGEVYTNDPEAAIQWPFLVGVGMSYGYGMRSGRLHEGIDFVPGDGAPAQSIADGTVRIATEQGGAYGVTVYIDHVIDGEVITSHYSHMQYGSLQVKAGDKVKVGDIVGKTGNTGRSYGAHMHFELIVNGSTIDPMPWLNENAGRYDY
ncbi:peptidoglycan DD-metalloendopeptidase family protein [Microbacterium sp. NPDC076768]|uniref:peptidoglycan DD-metalloendopeptidase family protein n=1 Tax=Microbacterium sp. NPDC076768 TaxID=3154858 RepID=UPI00344AC0A9